MVDNGSIIYTSNIDIVHIINHTKNFFKDEFLENEKEKIFLRNIKKKKFEYINYLSISKFRGKTKITISFSYSRFFKKDNFYICDSDKKIKEVHTHIIQLLQILAGKVVHKKDLKLIALDICYQLQTNFIDKYNSLMILSRILSNEQKTFYFSETKDKRKLLQGFSIFDDKKAKKERKTFFKIYNKASERLETKKFEEGQTNTIRAELSLKETQLKILNISSIDAVNRIEIENIIKKVLGDNIKKNLKKEIDENLQKLIEIVKDKNFSRKNIIEYEYLIFDIDFLKFIFSEKISGIKRSTGFYHKKLIIEELEKLEKTNEIVKKYSDNIKNLEKICDKLFKTKIKISATAEGVQVECLE